MVELVVHGIHDDNIRMNVMASKNKTLAELYQCLSTFPLPKVRESAEHIEGNQFNAQLDKVQDLRDLKKSPNSRSVVAVDSLRKWVTFDATQ